MVVSNIFFSPLVGDMIHFDEHIFQMGGFNHQPVSHRLAFLPMIDSKGADWLNRDLPVLSSGNFLLVVSPKISYEKNRCQPTLQGSVGMSHDWKPNYITTRVDPWK